MAMVTNGDGIGSALLQKLHPIFEVTPLIRPQLLLAAVTADQMLMLAGILWHRDKQAYQTRLRVLLPQRPAVLRRTRWRRFGSPATQVRVFQTVEQRFVELMKSVGSQQLLRAEFPPHATDAIILQTLLASGIPRVVS